VLIKRVPFSDDVNARWVFRLLHVVEGPAGVVLQDCFCVRQFRAEGGIVDCGTGCEVEESEFGDGHCGRVFGGCNGYVIALLVHDQEDVSLFMALLWCVMCA
jgi:hypothetical protein